MTALLVLIYVAFISLGLPDSLLGSVWPAMHVDLGADLSLAGVLGAVVCAGTVLSGLMSARLIARFGTARVTAVSVLMTAAAMLGMALSSSFILTLLLCIPLGLGGGAVDAALNNFVALHYRAQHMNWLHCFWGVGATLGPAVIGLLLRLTGQWRGGYLGMAAAQCVLAAVMFASLPLWRKAEGDADGQSESGNIQPMRLREVLMLPLAGPVLISLLAYCGAESVMNLWCASYLVGARGIAADRAASWVSLFFLGITLGRMLAGFLSVRMRPAQLVRAGVLLAIVGIALLLSPLDSLLPAACLLVGLGFAPVYPSMLHRTPVIFGQQASQSVMGIQMAFAYIGSTLMPPLAGALTHLAGMGFLPVFVLGLTALLLIMSERINRRLRARDGRTAA
ncbi:MAG: MFS transporter [Candidatus Limiplasma sp.]|nr:MFS transporter [Candidatus Limiplasma sp.]